MRGFIVFCSKCGRELPDGSKFCPQCGSPLMPSMENRIQATEAASSPRISNASVVGAKKSRKPLIIGGIAIVAVAAVVGVIFLVMSVFGNGNELVNGKYIFANNDIVYGLSYEVYEEDGKQKIDIGYAKDAKEILNVIFSGTFVEDGENDQGIIWKLVPDEEGDEDLDWKLLIEGDSEGEAESSTIRFQFPEGYAEGDVNGRWYLEETAIYSDGTSETLFSILEFNGSSLAIVAAYGDGALDGGLGVQDVLDNDASEKEDILEGKYYIWTAYDGESMTSDAWLNVSDEGNGAYSVELISQDNEGTITDHIDFMDINLNPER